jgi:glycosyltransferase involved in cell wall biosynthesis
LGLTETSATRRLAAKTLRLARVSQEPGRFIGSSRRICMAKVDVIIPTYNRSQFLQAAIASVLKQTFGDFTLFVVDDASEDDTRSIVESFNDKRIKYIRHAVNRGEAFARNTGVSNTSAAFVAFLDDDDEWLPKKLELEFDLLKNSPEKVGGVYSGLLIIDKNTGIVKGRKLAERRGDIYLDMISRNVLFTPSTVLLRTKCFEKVGLFDESIPWMLDYDMWIRISKEFHFECIKEPLVKYHLHKNRISNNASIRAKGLEAMLKKHHDLFSLNQKIHSQFYRDLGFAYGENQEFANASKAVLRAMKLHPFQARAYVDSLKLIGLCLGGPNNYMRLKQGKEHFISLFRFRPKKASVIGKQ